LSEKFIEDPQQEDFESSAFHDFFEIWRKMSEEGGTPQYNTFSMLTFSDHVSNMILVKYDYRSCQYQGKYFGSDLVDRIGFDPTNLGIEDLTNAESMRTRLNWLTKIGKPYLLLNIDLVWGQDVHKIYNIVNCPLFDKDDNVSAIVGLMEFSF
jgi:hypothetical protein